MPLFAVTEDDVRKHGPFVSQVFLDGNLKHGPWLEDRAPSAVPHPLRIAGLGLFEPGQGMGRAGKLPGLPGRGEGG